MAVIDLSFGMTARIREWYRLGNKIDVRLLFECAYYPRGGCQDCSWELPNSDCKWSHILIDTRIDGDGHLRMREGRKRQESLEKILSKLPKEVMDEIKQVLSGENKS
jgi:hypothetical protein